MSGARRRGLPGLAGIALAVAFAFSGCAGVPTETNATDGASLVPRADIDTDERRRARIRLELAAGYYQQRNLSVALDEIRQALTIDPNYAAAYGILGLIYMDLDEREKADQSFREGLRLHPGNADLNNNYGWFLCRTGREREAIPHFEQALRDPLYTTPSRPLHNAGLCLRRIGDLAGAETYLRRAFQVDPANPVAMFNLSEIYLGRNELDKASFYAQRLVTMHPPTAQTLWLALKVEHRRGNGDAEQSLATQLRRRFPGSREAELLSQGRYGD